MDITFKNINFDTSSYEHIIVDSYESFIWTDRYDECGDFELYLPTDRTSELAAMLNHDDDVFVRIPQSDRTMVVEKVLTEADIEDGAHTTVSGRSAESILERRIIWGLKTISGSFQDAIEELLDENAINPEDPNRAIPNLSFSPSTDPYILGLTVDAQYTGENLYTAIQELCHKAHVGFKMDQDISGALTFSLYVGTDRSFYQATNQAVIFSPRFDNLINSNFLRSKETLKNVTLIGGEGEGAEKVFVAYSPAQVSGLARREIYTNASSVSSKVEGSEDPMPAEEYEQLLINEGEKVLADNEETLSFEGEADANIMFKYGRDFFIGDIVQVEDDYGHVAPARVSEFIYSDDDSGTSYYPTFKALSEEEDDE